MVIGHVFRHDDNWLTVDPIVGCLLNCQYCFLQVHDKTPRKGIVLLSPREVLDQLVQFPLYRPEGVVMFGSETDFFMDQQNISYLIELLRLYDERRIGNTVVLMTKCHIPNRFIQLVKNLHSTRVLFYLSYSGLPREIEPGVDHQKLRRNFERLSAAELEIIHYWRPLIPQNSSPEAMAEVIDFVSQYARCSRATGIKINSAIRNRLWFWKSLRNSSFDPNQVGAVWTKEAIHFFETTKLKKHPDYPVFYANSCALAYVLGKPDFNGFYNSRTCNNSHCPTTQRQICQTELEEYVPDMELVRTEFKKLELSGEVTLDQTKRAIVVNEPIEHGTLVYLTQLLKYRVISSHVDSDHEWGGDVIGREDVVFEEGSLGDVFLK